MTLGQKLIYMYLYTQYPWHVVYSRPVEDYCIQIVDENGHCIMLTMNIFCDILDHDTKQMIAESDIPHDLDAFVRNPEWVPTRWTNCQGYFK